MLKVKNSLLMSWARNHELTNEKSVIPGMSKIDSDTGDNKIIR